MKKLLFLFPLLLPVLLAAQVEFAPLGATWYFEDNAPPLPWKLSYIKVEVTGIDTIQGRACKRIESKNIYGYSDWGCSFYAPLLQTYQENGRVFSYHDGDFYLLYDFNANAGDSWVIHNPPLTLGDSLVVEVDSVSFINTNGTTLKVQHVSNPGLGPGELLEWGSIIVEGIGNTGFIAPQYGVCDPWIFGLRCFQSDSIDLHLVNFPCDSTKSYVATQEPILRGGLFSPNPVLGNSVSLNTSLDADRVVLQNAWGTTQISLTIQSGNPIETGALPAGVYFVSVFKGARLLGLDKLVILKE